MSIEDTRIVSDEVTVLFFCKNIIRPKGHNGKKHTPPGRVHKPLILIRAHFYTPPSGCSASGRSRLFGCAEDLPSLALRRLVKTRVTNCHKMSRNFTKLPFSNEDGDAILYHEKEVMLTFCSRFAYVLLTKCSFPWEKKHDIIILRKCVVKL